MAIEEAAIGRVAAELMEQLAELYDDDATIERVAIVVAVDRGHETTVHLKVTEGTPVYVSKGLLTHVAEHLG